MCIEKVVHQQGEPEDLRDQQLSFDYHEWQIDRGES